MSRGQRNYSTELETHPIPTKYAIRTFSKDLHISSRQHLASLNYFSEQLQLSAPH